LPQHAEQWAKKRDYDKAQGLPLHSLVEYSELTELASIIEKRWNDGFGDTVSNKSSRVVKAIRALIPHRNYEFHSRKVTPEQLIGIVHLVQRLEPFLVGLEPDGESDA